MRVVRLFFLLFLFPSLAYAQSENDWQQRVHYDMKVSLKADRHKVKGTQRLRYTNNSPDTLHRVYYHLYFNAFNPHSMMAERNRHLPDPDSRIVPRIFNLGPQEAGYQHIQRLTQDGKPLDFEITDTVMRVNLADPILPGETVTFRMQFRSQVPLQTRRSGRDNEEGIDYSMTQWYPKMAEYDKQGWNADPYVGREFYGVYGTFDVDITLPASYTIGATGTLQNPEQIGHGYDETGTYHPDANAPSRDSLTWRFHAEHVHDFAWAADPDYIHENILKNGLRYHLLYQPRVEEQWEAMSQWTPEIISFRSRKVGPYPYPQFTVAQAGDGGMEYPMMVLITGRRSPGSLLGVTAHEASHEWFYGVLGSNESEYAWMDEGFTSYSTTENVAHVRGKPADHTGARINYLYAKDRNLFEPLNTPADWYTTNAAYGIASYPSGAMFVDMLNYVIGDKQQDRWLHTYYDRFKFRHPGPRDLEKTAEDVSDLRLDWYFEQFLDMNRSLDYGLGDLRSKRTDQGWKTHIEMKREDDVVMPIDLQLTYADGSTQWVNVPLGIMQGHKPVPGDWIVAKPWLWTFPDYTFEATLPKQVVEAEIDPKGMMPDENRLNNTSGFPLQADFLHPPEANWFDYSLGYRPLVQYANDFGPGVGMQARGQYLFGDHRTRAMLKLWPSVLFTNGDQPEDGLVSTCLSQSPNRDCNLDGSWFDGLDYEVSFAENVEALGTDAVLKLQAEKHLGVLENRLSFKRPLTRYGDDFGRSVSVSIVHQFSPSARQFSLDRAPTHVNDQHVVSAHFQFAVTDGQDQLRAQAEVGSAPPAFSGPSGLDATRFSLSAAKSFNFAPAHARAAFRFGMGSRNLIPFKRFRLGAASTEARWQNDGFRSIAAAFDDPRGDAHLAAFNGTGPVAYLLSSPQPYLTDESYTFFANGGVPRTRNLLEGRLSLSTRLPLKNTWLRPLRLEAFSGIGTFWNEPILQVLTPSDDLGRLIADAGLGARYDVSALKPFRSLVAQSDVLSDLKIVAQFPLWASDPELIEPNKIAPGCGVSRCSNPEVIQKGQDAFEFRWLLGIQTGL